MQDPFDRMRAKIESLRIQARETENHIHHLPKNTKQDKIDLLNAKLKDQLWMMQYHQDQLSKLEKQHARLVREVKNTAHHNAIQAKQDLAKMAMRQAKRRERYLKSKQQNNVTQ